jgi:tetratricopeptide (TPR) repeat protein
MADVFISYSSVDRTIADAVCASLESNGVSCWIAPRDIPAGSYAAAIVKAINDSRLMVLVFSSSSNKSPQVEREIERAVSKNKAIYPLRIENVLPSPDLELFISSEQWMDAFERPIEPRLEIFSRNVKQLLADATSPDSPRLEDVRKLTDNQSRITAWTIVAAILVLSAFVTALSTVVHLLKGGANSFSIAGGATQILLVFLAGSTFLTAGRKLLGRSWSRLNSVGAARVWFDMSILIIVIALRVVLPGLGARYLNYKGDLEFAKDQFDDAISNYQGAEAIKYNSARSRLAKAYFSRGLRLDKMRAYAEAAGQYQLAIEYDPSDYAATNNLARMFILQGNPNRALSLLNQLVQNLSSLPVEVHYFIFKNVGWANLELHNYFLAEMQLKWALIRRQGAAAQYLLGRVYDEQGRHAEAKQQWDAFIQSIQTSSKSEEEVEPDWPARAQELLHKG